MATVVAFPGRREFCLLETSISPRPIGVLLVENGGIRGLRLLPDFDDFEDPEYLEALASDLTAKLREEGGEKLLQWMEDTLSGFLLISERKPARGQSLDRLFEQYVAAHEDVEQEVIRPYQTHLPIYPLSAAATKFGEESGVEQARMEDERWVKVSGLRLAPGMFIAHVNGRSMEPLIPDGSLCVFRAPVIGSRQGKKLLIEQFGVSGDTARYTIKKYTSEKVQHEDGSWEHSQIRLEPLNPEFEAFHLGPDEFRVIAEFVKVLE